MTSALKPVLILGGSGFVGSRAVAALRTLQPSLPITIGARDLARAGAVAKEFGNVDTAKVDITRPDLGLPEGSAFSAVVTLLKDETLNSMKYAQKRGLPYVSFSSYLFEIAPEVALYIRKPTSAPILLLGHAFGGASTLAALHFAREFQSVDTLRSQRSSTTTITAGPRPTPTSNAADACRVHSYARTANGSGPAPKTSSARSRRSTERRCKRAPTRSSTS